MPGLLVVGLAGGEVLDILELANNGVETAVLVMEALSGKEAPLVVETLSMEKALDNEASVREAPLEEALVKEKPVKEVPGVMELFEISDEIGEAITALVDAPMSVLLNEPASTLLVLAVAESGVAY